MPDNAMARATRGEFTRGSLLAAPAAALATIVLLGWALPSPALTTLGQEWTPMVVSTALTILLAASAALWTARRREGAWLGARVAGALITVIGLTTLVNVLAASLAGAALYSTGPAWRMAPNTAVAVTMLGSAMLLMGRSRRANLVAECLLGGTLLVAVVMLLAFLLGATPKSDLMGRVNMSPITAASLLLAVTPWLLLVPGGMVADFVGGDQPGSRMARPWFALVTAVPIVLGWARLEAHRRELGELEYTVAVMVIGSVVTAGLAMFALSRRVNRYDAVQRREQEARLFLARASDLLAPSLDVRAMLGAVADLAVPALADWCSLALCQPDGTLEVLAVVHRDPAKAEWARDYQRRFSRDPDGTSGAIAVARTGTPQFYPDIPEAMLAVQARDEEQLRVLRALGMRSAVFVPLRAGGKTVGVLTLVTSESGRRFTHDDLRTAEQLAERCGAATERARLFEELRELTAKLEHRVAQRTSELALANRELESFAYSVSHDLRTPLRALDGFSQALLEDYSDRLDETGSDYLNRIRRGSQRMGELIDALLELSRVTRSDMQRQEVDLSAMARDIFAGLRDPTPSRQVELVVEPGMTAIGDARLLRALLQNLLGNAWKFTSKRPDARIEFRMDADTERGAVFTVLDNGAGFDMAHASKLFGAFQRLHTTRDFEGTGVGLATVQRIVHRHGGQVWAEAVPGQGASFHFTLDSEEAVQ